MPKVQRNHQNQPAQNHDANLVTKTPKAAHSWRAERACDTCRKKKARCETAELSSGSSSRSCLNCVAAGTECTFTDEYSRRATSKFYVDHLEQKVKDMEALLRTLALRVDMSADLEQHGLRSLLGSTKNSHDPMLSCSKNADGPAACGCNHSLETCLSHHHDIEFEDCDPEQGGHGDRFQFTEPHSYCSLALVEKDSPQFLGDSCASNPKSPPGCHIDNTPVDWEQTLLSIPPPNATIFPPEDLMDTLLGLYFRHFAPFLPVLDRSSFEIAYKDGLHLRSIPFANILLLACAIASQYCDDPRVWLEGIGRPSAGWSYFMQVRDSTSRSYASATLLDIQSYVMIAYFLATSSRLHSAWTVVGMGIRSAQNIGMHRRKSRKESPLWKDEQHKRVFWCLIALDRHISSALGRPLVCKDEDFDLDYPLEVDDEHWGASAPDGSSAVTSRQHHGVPSEVSYLVASARLSQILAFTLSTVYSISKSKVVLGFEGDLWKQHITSELDSKMNKWFDAVPDHLKWDPSQQNDTYFPQSAILFASYYNLQILIHRPFIHPLNKHSPSLSICTNAARSCSHVVEILLKRSTQTPVFILSPVFNSGVVLVAAILSAKKDVTSVDGRANMKALELCMTFLERAQEIWQCSKILANTLRHLMKSEGIGNLQPQVSLDHLDIVASNQLSTAPFGVSSRVMSTCHSHSLPNPGQLSKPTGSDLPPKPSAAFLGPTCPHMPDLAHAPSLEAENSSHSSQSSPCAMADTSYAGTKLDWEGIFRPLPSRVDTTGLAVHGFFDFSELLGYQDLIASIGFPFEGQMAQDWAPHPDPWASFPDLPPM